MQGMSGRALLCIGTMVLAGCFFSPAWRAKHSVRDEPREVGVEAGDPVRVSASPSVPSTGSGPGERFEPTPAELSWQGLAGSVRDDCFLKDVGDACWQIGWAYQNGSALHYRPVPQDFARAAGIYTHGCNLGSVASCSSLGKLMRDGSGVPKQVTRAAELFADACERGDGLGCFWLGGLLLSGEGVPRDESRAAAVLRRACFSSKPIGCDLLASIEGTATFATGEKPTGAAGFRFGSSAADAASVCERSGNVWEGNPAEGFSCLRRAGWSLPVPVYEIVFTFCEERLCSITLGSRLGQNKESFAQFEGALERLYGIPGTRARLLPDQCKSLEAFMDCVKVGQARVSDYWKWPDETSILLALVSFDGEWHAAISYSSPAAMKMQGYQGL